MSENKLSKTLFDKIWNNHVIDKIDDSNINKFTKVLREFSNKTQFIVVTHNKLTMEKADYMYGITQEEEGVSKIVSVKLKQGEMEEEAVA